MYHNIHYKYYTYTLTEPHHWHSAGGFVINANRTTNTNTIISALMYSYHERLLNHTCMDQPTFNKAYKSKHMITTISSTPPVGYKFVQSAQLAAQHQS